jgi:flagellar hook protein FlgE
MQVGGFDSMYTAISGLQAQAFAFQNISGNIANSQTTAYKAVGTSFEDMLNGQMLGGAGSVQALSTESNTQAGTIVSSSIATNMAISGDGYFSVETPTTIGTGGQPIFSSTTQEYTQRGDFQLDASGYLVNGDGNYLMGVPLSASGSPLSSTPQLLQFNAASLPSGQGALQGISIGSNGTIVGTFASGQQIPLASVPLSSFSGEDFLQQNTDGTLSPTALSGAAFTSTTGTIVGGALETANSSITDQFTAMIQTQQAYSANSNVIGTTSQMLQTATNLIA